MENSKISIQELVDLIASQTDFTKKFSEEFLRELFHVIQEYLEKDGIVKVKGLGTFKLVWNEERKSVNVTTGEPIILPGYNKVTFLPDSAIKETVNKPYAHLETVNLSEDTTTSTKKDVTMAARILPTIEEEIIHDAKNETPLESKEINPKKSKKSKTRIVFIVVLVVFHLLMAVATYFYKTEIYDFFASLFKPVILQQDDYIIEEEVPELIVPIDTTVVTDTIQQDTIIADTMTFIEPVYSPEVAQNAPVKTYAIVNEGSRLTWIAYKEYGHRDFWVYIYDANRHQLNSPNDLRIGMKLIVPDLDQSLVNPDDENCLIKAREIAKNYK